MFFERALHRGIDVCFWTTTLILQLYLDVAPELLVFGE
jgi:hypothetical protein